VFAISIAPGLLVRCSLGLRIIVVPRSTLLFKIDIRYAIRRSYRFGSSRLKRSRGGVLLERMTNRAGEVRRSRPRPSR